jgi:hypothetical protein
MAFRRIILSSTSITWGILGFSRGLQCYDYRYKKDIDYNKLYYKKTNYFYTTKIGFGFYGLFMYLNPLFIPFIITKEIYRVEVDIRGLEDEKNTDYYNEVL